jgi:hypothetical protein
MKRWIVAICLAAMSFAGLGFGQGAWVVGGVEALVKQLGIRGGKSATEEIVKLGGERGVQAILDKAGKEGGQQLVDKMERYSLDYGTSILRGAKDTPLKFVSAFEKLPTPLRTGALQEIRREPEVMQSLILKYGETALEAGARHPGVGPTVLSKIGGESSEFLVHQPTDQVIRVARLADDIGKAPPAEQKALLSMIQQAPEKILNILETHPNILKTGAVLTAFLAAKNQILGSNDVIIGPDGKPVVVRKPGIMEKMAEQVTGILKIPLLIIAAIVGLGLLFYIWRLLPSRKHKL